MADKDTLNLIKFKFGSFQSIKDLSSKDQSSFYFASDAPAFYNAGLWYGVSSLTSSVNEDTGEVTLVINGGFGDNWEKSQVEHTFVAGMTTQQKADLEKAVSFVKTFEDPNIDNTKDVIDKWNEIVAFLAGFKDTDVLLDRIKTIETKVTNLQNTTITGGDGLTGGGNLLGYRTIAMGTPSTITDSTINEAKGTTHTHAINEASTEQRGIVRLNDSLTSESTDQALTAKQGKVLKENIDDVLEHIDDMFELIDKGNGVKEIKAKYGLWSDSFISARGVDNESSGVGGLDAQSVWDLLMQNDDATKVINIAHIPDITVAKITDFTTKVGDLIANKADKATTLLGYGITDAVTLNTEQTITGGKTFSNLRVNNSTMIANLNAEMVGGVKAENIARQKVGIDINNGDRNYMGYGYGSNGWYVGGGPAICAGTKDYYMMLFGYPNALYYKYEGIGYLDQTWKTIAFTDTNSLTPSGGTLTVDGKLTATSLAVNSTTMVTNLNADKVDGYDSTGLFTCESGDDINVNAPHPNKESGTLLYKINFNCANIPPSCADGVLVNFNCPKTDTAFQIASNYQNTGLYYRSGNLNENDTTYLYNRAWKTIAFTDTSSLTPSSGTLSIDGVVKISDTLYTNNILPSNGYSDWIGSKDTAFNIYTPNIILKNTYTSIQNNNLGRWFRILDLSECNNSSAIVSISKGYNNNPSGGTIFAVNANSYDAGNCMITVLSGNLGLIKKIRVVVDWMKSYVDVYIDNLDFDSTETYNISKIGEGTIVNFEPLEEAGGTVRAELDITIGFSCSSSLYGAGLNINGTALINGDTTINGKLTVANQLTIGNATIYWDVANQCLRVNSGIASDSFLSAKGIDTTGNGQGGGGGLDATMLWNELTIPSPTNSGKVISSQFLPVQEILTPVAEDISAINVEIIALQDRIANIEQALTWQTL